MISRIAISLMSLAWCTMAAALPEVARVEGGLLPPVTMLGERTQTMHIAERMTHYDVPAISVAVIENGRIAWARAYGTLARTGAEPATVDTLFQAGSLSKPVTAAGALLLVEDGTLLLDAPVNNYLASWKVPLSDQEEGGPVTLRGLLSHTAGLTVHGFRGYAAGEAVPTLRQILDGAPPANSEPVRIDQAAGSALLYSGGGYVVAQQMVEDVTGRPFAAFMREEVLRPVGMAASTFEPSLAGTRTGRAAIGHRADGSKVPGGWHSFPEMAPAGLWSTPTDLARFALWLMKGLKDDASPAHAVASRMMEPQRDLSGREFATPAGNKAGLGLVLEGEGPTLRFSHSGSNPGQKAFVIGFPETGQGAAIMANSDASPRLIQEILRALAAEYRWPERFHRTVRPVEFDKATLQALAGTYSFESRQSQGQKMRIAVSSSDGLLLAKLPDGSNYRLRPVSATRFLDPDTEMTLTFEEPGTVRVPAYGITAKRD